MGSLNVSVGLEPQGSIKIKQTRSNTSVSSVNVGHFCVTTIKAMRPRDDTASDSQISQIVYLQGFENSVGRSTIDICQTWFCYVLLFSAMSRHDDCWGEESAWSRSMPQGTEFLVIQHIPHIQIIQMSQDPVFRDFHLRQQPCSHQSVILTMSSTTDLSKSRSLKTLTISIHKKHGIDCIGTQRSARPSHTRSPLGCLDPSHFQGTVVQQSSEKQT